LAWPYALLRSARWARRGAGLAGRLARRTCIGARPGVHAGCRRAQAV